MYRIFIQRFHTEASSPYSAVRDAVDFGKILGGPTAKRQKYFAKSAKLKVFKKGVNDENSWDALRQRRG
ncbi:hypothetical protein TNCV_4312381 [Trichonephila clavipes]|nr:hypothetical protein TNCV_4312381 [Trichonephila clavipes]